MLLEVGLEIREIHGQFRVILLLSLLLERVVRKVAKWLLE